MNRAQKNILVVDDLKTNRIYISRFFEEKQFAVYSAEDGYEALQILETATIDIILLDVEMPHLDGYATCKKIKADNRWKNIPVIFITSRDDEASILKGFETGAQDFVVKPFNETELYARVKTHLELKAKSEQLVMLNKYLEEIVSQRTFQLKQTLAELESAYKEIEASHKTLQTLSLAKVNFLKIISHEIRTPLNGIVGFVDVLQDTVETDELKAYVNYLAKSAARLDRFATDAIMITELMLDDYHLELSDFLIQEVIDEIEDSLEEQIIQKGVKLVYEPLGSSRMYADRKLITIAVRHVVENAVKYSPDGDVVLIRSIEDDGYIAQIIIKDNGPGFSEAAMNSLFDLFALGQDHADSHSGLGVALTNLIMKTLGGKVLVKNNSQGGSTVTLYL